MARVVIECDVPDDMVDPDDHTGLTEEGFNEIVDVLIEVGAVNVDVFPAS